MDPLGVDGAFLFSPRVHGDTRGSFHEWFQGGVLRERTGHTFTLAQANCSVSSRGVLRGVHFADVPPGQAKYVTCVRGAILDAAVDLRVGSPTFGRHATVRLDAENRDCLYLGEGLGHAFQALTDDTIVIYLCSEPYAPGREHGVHPLDPELGIAWEPGIEPVLSEKDAAAPTLAQAREAGLLPDYEKCLRYADELRAR